MRQLSVLRTHKYLVSGQAILEYAVFIAVIAAALTTMSVYVRRAIQANLKGVEDQINGEAKP